MTDKVINVLIVEDDDAHAELVVESFADQRGNYDVTFDDIYVPVVLRQGALRWNGVRLISEDLAIMGNGMVSMRDGHLSVTRLVASPESASLLTAGIRGLDIIDEKSRWWFDLDTPDRKVRDLVISGPLLEAEINAGADYESILVGQIIAEIHKFFSGEKNDGSSDLKATPVPSDTEKNIPKS